MSAKAILVLCAQALLPHVAFSQCSPSIGAASCGALGGNGLSYGAGVGYGADRGIRCGHRYVAPGLSTAGIEVIPTSGGALPVSSICAIAPTGLSIMSKNTFEGLLHVAGELPFLSAVALEAVFPTVGTGVVNYGCGNGITAITSDAGYSAGVYDLGAAGIGSGAVSYGSGVAAIPPAVIGVAGHACGCDVY